MKLHNTSPLLLLFLSSFLPTTLSQKCTTASLQPSYTTPIVADGWQAQLIVQGLKAPRSILFDSNGGLLVVQQGAGIVHLNFTDNGGSCLEVAQKTYLINSTLLNHGIALSPSGKTLYASSSEALYSWTYDPISLTLSAQNRTLITGMSNSDHTTRTLLMSQKSPDTLLVSRGSDSNIDSAAQDISTGHSQVKAFNVTELESSSNPSSDFASSGLLLGWGVRNSVGLAEHPSNGGIFSVENSADEIFRGGVNIHLNNPGEEMNFHGFLNGSTEHQGGNYGYPDCFALWNTSIPDLGTMEVGSQFTIDNNGTVNDAFCAGKRVSPRLTFQAHMAPLDIIFQPNGTEAYVSFHGSWDRSPPVGYKVSSIPFSASTGQPLDASNSTTSTTDIFSNPDLTVCPKGCFRPVGLALDTVGRLFVSSDATGEIWVLVKAGSGSTDASASPSSTATGRGGATATGPSASASGNPTGKKNGAGRSTGEIGGMGIWWSLVAFLGIATAFF